MYRVTGVGGGGISQDLPDRDTPPQFVGVAHNVTASGGMLRVSYGFAESVTVDQPILHMQPIDDTRLPRHIMLIGSDRVYGWNGATVTDITNNLPMSVPQPGDKWSSCQMGGIAIFSHHGEYPRSWTPRGGGREQYLVWDATHSWEDMKYTAGVVRNYKNFIVAGHVHIEGRQPPEAPRMVRWSASVTDTYTLPYWPPLPTNDAGEVELADLSTGIIDMMNLGDAMIIYGSETAYLMQWVGGAYVMRFQKLKHIPGVIGKNMVIPVLNNHFVVGQSDVYLHSTGLPQSIVDNKLRRTIYAQLTDEALKYAFLAKVWDLDEIWLCIPTEKDELGVLKPYATTAYAWNWVTNTWTTRDIPNALAGISGVTPTCEGGTCPTWDDPPFTTWDGWPGNWDDEGDKLSNHPELIFSSADSKLYQRADGFGEFTPSEILRTGLDIENYEQQYTVISAYPAIEKASAMVQIGVQDAEGSGVKWSKPQRFVPGESKKLDLRGDNLTGSLLSYRIYSDEPSVFEFSGLEMVFSVAGRDG